MANITPCTQAPIVNFFGSFYSNQPLMHKVAKVFFVCLAAVVSWVIFRVIKAGNAPVVEEGSLWIFSRTTGSIGKDRKYRFGETLQLQNGKPLQVAATDRYVDTTIHYKGQDKSIQDQFPSSLFAEARQGDQVCFCRNGKLHRLTLISRPTKNRESSFEDCLKSVEDEWHHSLHEFLYEEDVPDSYKRWSVGTASVFLSPATRQVVVGQKGARPIDLEALQLISTQSGIDVLSKGKIPDQNIFQYRLAAAGTPKITILVDRNHLYVHTFSETVLQEGEVLLKGSLRKECFLHSLLFKDSTKVDKENIEAALDDKGVLTINIPLI